MNRLHGWCWQGAFIKQWNWQWGRLWWYMLLGCYNDTCIKGGLPYGDVELPCQLGSGGGNDSTAGGGVLGVC